MTRCGKCEACKYVEATKRIVLAECRPAGPGCNDATVEMWNKVLKDNPCEEEINAATEAGYDKLASGWIG